MKSTRKNFTSDSFTRLLILIMVCLLLQTDVHSQIRTGAASLKIIPGTRQLGIAGSLTGTIDNMATVYANPGATGFLREWQWSASYTRWIPDVYTASLFYGKRVRLPWSRHTRIALGLSYLGIKNFDSTNGRQPQANGSDLLALVSIGQPLNFISKWLSWGGNVKFFRSHLGGFNDNTFIFDTGLLYRSPRFSFLESGPGILKEGILSVGLAITQMGGGLNFRNVDTPLPRTFRAGVSLNTGTHRGLQLHLTADYRDIRDEDPFFSIGSELSLKPLLAFRAGYNFEKNNVLGNLAFGVSLGFDDIWSKLQGRNKAVRLDLAKLEENIFFTSPSRASVNYFPIDPEGFHSNTPINGAVLKGDRVMLTWEDTKDPDLFDNVKYALLVDQNFSKLSRIIEKIETWEGKDLLAVFDDTKNEVQIDDELLVNRILDQQSFHLNELLCGDYFWTVIAYDKDKHYRVCKNAGHQISQFSVASPDLYIEQIVSPAELNNCQCFADIVVGNKGNIAAKYIHLSIYHNDELQTVLVDSTELQPDMTRTFKNISLGDIHETHFITAWVNKDMRGMECDTTNNKKQEVIRCKPDNDVQITKRADRKKIKFGEQLNYTITVANRSQCEARNITVVDLPSAFMDIVAFHAPFPIDSTRKDSLVWKLDYLAGNDSVVVKYSAVMKPLVFNINFKNDQYQWSKNGLVDSIKAQKDLDILAIRLDEILEINKDLALKIIGYTSSPADSMYNEKLSRSRARTIRAQLIDRMKKYNNNIDEHRIDMEGRGERQEFLNYVNDFEDLVDNTGKIVITKEEKQKANRRVELTFINPLKIMNQCEVIVEQDRNLKNNKAVTVVQVE